MSASSDPLEHPSGAVRFVMRRFDFAAKCNLPKGRKIWLPDTRDEHVRAVIRRGALAIKAWDERHPEFIAELGAMADEVMAMEPDYDWGPGGPP